MHSANRDKSRRLLKRLRIVAIVMAILGGAWLAAGFLSPREPGYQGRSLTEWLIQAQLSSNASADPQHPEQDPNWIECQNALVQMDDAVFPILLRELTAKESKLKPTLMALTRQKLWPTVLRKKLFGPLSRAAIKNETNTSERQVRAIYGFALLEQKARPVEKKLAALCASDDRDERLWGFLALTCTEPEKKTLVSVVSQLLKDPDSEIRSTAAESLVEAYPEEAEGMGIYQKFPELRPVEQH